MKKLQGNVLPCPFCGNTRIYLIKEKDYDCNIHDTEEKVRQAEVWFHCVCLQCKAKTQEQSSENKAIESWNMRVGK